MKARLIVLSLLLCLSAPAVAEVFKWTDDNGKVQYSEIPPGDRPYAQVGGSTRPSADAAAAEERLNKQRAALDQARKETEEQDRQRAADKQMQARNAHDEESCARANHNLETLQAHTQVIMQDPDTGQQTRLSNEQREAQIRQSLKDIQYYCEG